MVGLLSPTLMEAGHSLTPGMAIEEKIKKDLKENLVAVMANLVSEFTVTYPMKAFTSVLSGFFISIGRWFFDFGSA